MSESVLSLIPCRLSVWMGLSWLRRVKFFICETIFFIVYICVLFFLFGGRDQIGRWRQMVFISKSFEQQTPRGTTCNFFQRDWWRLELCQSGLDPGDHFGSWIGLAGDLETNFVTPPPPTIFTDTHSLPLSMHYNYMICDTCNHKLLIVSSINLKKKLRKKENKKW